MAKTYNWTVPIDSETYEISLTVSAWSNNHVCMVNGTRVDLPGKFVQFFTGLDYPLALGTATAHLVIIGSKADLAVNDVYLGTENPYLPLQPIPWWTWLFVALCAFLAVSLSPLAAMIAIFGAVYCIRTVISPYYSTSMKVGYCFTITLACWFAYLFILSIASGAGLFS
ncbi:MAG: hypothetical protein ACYCX2_00795 [Christensenellales bacterium]